MNGLTPKAVGTIGVVGVLLFAGLLLGRVELVALAAPLVTALLWGLGAATDAGVEAGATVGTDRAVEGDEVEVRVALSCSRKVDEVLVGVALPAGIDVVEGDKLTTVALDAGRELRADLTVTPVRWGAYEIGPLVVRAYSPLRFLAHEWVHPVHGTLRVYPAQERLQRGFPPARTQVFAGNYVARSAGEGIEFSGVREYAPTDDVKRINWRVTSRRGSLYINVYHPERNADVVMFLDTFGDVGRAGQSTLDLTVKGATALARHFLTRKDRVGLVNFGGTLGWITAAQGQPHTYRIVDYLLGVRATWSYAWKDLDFLPIGILPPLSTVIAFSPLLDKRAVGALVDLHGRGFPLVIVDTLVQEGVVATDTPEGRLAWKVWRMQRAAVDYDLERLGIPVVRWPADGSLEGALARVPALRRRPKARLA